MESYLKVRPAHSNQLYLILTGFAMKFLGVAALFLYIAGGIFFVVHNVDPLGKFVLWTLSNCDVPLLLITIVRPVVMLMLGTELYRVLITYFLSAVIVLVTINWSLNQLITLVSETAVQRSRIRVSRRILFMKAADSFRAFEVYFKKNQEVYAASIPAVIFCGSTLMVLSNYCAIKLHGMFSIVMYLIFPTLSVCVVMFVLTNIYCQLEANYERRVCMYMCIGQ